MTSAGYLQAPYRKCCAVLRKETEQCEQEIAFCDWLGEEFGVDAPLAVAADVCGGRNRLWIIFPVKDVDETFYVQTETFYGRDAAKEDLILAKANAVGLLDAIEIIPEALEFEISKPWWKFWQRQPEPPRKPDPVDRSDTWFVAYAAFAPMALVEATNTVPKAALERIKTEFSDAGIWCIERYLGGFAVMFFTEAQRMSAENDKTLNRISETLKDAIRPYDEFDSLQYIEPRITFDSKEVFDRDYDGSWFKYTR